MVSPDPDDLPEGSVMTDQLHLYLVITPDGDQMLRMDDGGQRIRFITGAGMLAMAVSNWDATNGLTDEDEL